MVNENSCKVCGASVSNDEQFCEEHKNPPICPECKQPIDEVSERYVNNHYKFKEGHYLLYETCYDAADYFCTNCGAELSGDLRQKIVELFS